MILTPIQSKSSISFKDQLKFIRCFLRDSNINAYRSNHENCKTGILFRYPHCCQCELRVHSQDKSSAQRGGFPPVPLPQGGNHFWKHKTLLRRAIKTSWAENLKCYNMQHYHILPAATAWNCTVPMPQKDRHLLKYTTLLCRKHKSYNPEHSHFLTAEASWDWTIINAPTGI